MNIHDTNQMNMDVLLHKYENLAEVENILKIFFEYFENILQRLKI